MNERARLHQIQQELRYRTSHGQPEAAQLVMWAIGALPYPLHGALSREVYCANWFSTILSYIPGRARPRSFAGAAVAHAYPVLPIAEGVGLAIGIMPWAGGLGFGITTDPALLPDADQLAPAVLECFDALAEEHLRR